MSKQMNINWKYVLGAGFIIGLATYLWKGKSQKTNNKTLKPITQISEQVQLTFEQKYTKVITEIKKLWDKQSDHSDKLNAQIINAIYCGQYELANEKAKQIILKCRRKRRRSMQDKAQYCKICQKYQKQLEQNLEKQLGGILARFKIDLTTWMNETMRWSSQSEQASQEWSNLLRVQDEKQLDSLREKGKKQKPFSVIKNALQYKVKQLEIIEGGQLFVDGQMDENSKFNVLQSYICDLVFDKFALEPEDIQYSITKYNQQCKKQLLTLSDQISDLMSQLIYTQQSGDDQF